MNTTVHAFAHNTLERISLLSKKPNGKTYLMQDSFGRLYVKKLIDEEKLPIYQQLQVLKHPGLSEIFAIEKEDDDYFVIQEYIDGETLADKLDRQGKMSEDDAIGFIRQLCLILDKIHQRGIIHRDVNPSNIVIAPNNKLVLIDFDIARTYKEEQVRDTQLLGTPGYAAPEQFGFGQTSASSDIFALGTVFHVMLTGEVLTEEASVQNEKLAAIIQSCTTIDPAKRYQDALQVDYDLRQLSAAPVSGHAKRVSLPLGKMAIAVIAAIAAFSLLAGALLLVNAGGDDSAPEISLPVPDDFVGAWHNGSGDNLERPFRGPTSFSLALDEVEFLEDGTINFVFNHRDGHTIEEASIWQLNDAGTLLIVEGSEYAIDIEGNVLKITDSVGRQRLWQRSD